MLLEPNDQGLKLGEGDPFTMVPLPSALIIYQSLIQSRAMKDVER